MQTPSNPLIGFLNVDKPTGWTSSDVVAKLRAAFQLRRRRIKIGHGGTLDPLATGVLPVAIGKATRLTEFFLHSDKTYLMSATLGVVTDTYDSEGKIVDQSDWHNITMSDLESALSEFLGETEQVPPMFSAIKKDGQPLYKLARQGKTVERPVRRVRVRSLDLVAWNRPKFEVRIECGSGFYARSLAHDIGQRLRCGAHMTSLRREKAGEFSIEDALPIDVLIEGAHDDSWSRYLAKPDQVLGHLEDVILNEVETISFVNGRSFPIDPVSSVDRGSQLRAYANSGELLGLARHDSASEKLKPVKVLRTVDASTQSKADIESLFGEEPR